MTLKEIEGHQVVVDPMVADPLHIRQLIRSLKHAPITGANEDKNSQIAGFLTGNHNEIVRIAYLLHVNGAMFNFEYLPVKGKRPIDLNGNYLKDWPDKKFSIEECLSAKGATGIGVKTGLHLLVLDFDGETAFHLASEEGINWPMNEGWEVRRDDEPWRYKQLFTPTPEQIALLPNGEFQGKVVTKKAVKDADGEVIKKAEALEVFLTPKRQVVIIGEHPDGGNYFWPTSNQPEILKPLKPPTDEEWNFVLKLANQKPTASTKSKSPSSNGDWDAARPCPICGRDKDEDCRAHKDGDTILCHRGNTFHPPSMDLGEIIAGTKWAYCGSGEDCTGTFSTFKIHRPTSLQAIRKLLAEEADAQTF